MALVRQRFIYAYKIALVKKQNSVINGGSQKIEDCQKSDIQK